MLNYFNFKEINGQILLTNDFGKFVFLEKEDFENLVHGRIDRYSHTGLKLTEAKILLNESVQAFAANNIHLLRDSKNYLFTSTSLHIFVVTTSCNMNCIYCQANNGTKKTADVMDKDTATRAVDIALESPSLNITFEFQGGEPLLNYPIIKHIVEYAEKKKGEKHIAYSLVSNLTLLTEEMLDFFKTHHIGLSTSLDGDKPLHNKNRPYPNKNGTYSEVASAIDRIRKAGLDVGAIQTTTRSSLSHAKEIVDTYCDLGFSSIFIRPLTPLGCASRVWNEIGYMPEEFCSFYQEILTYIIGKNKDGYRLQENYAATLFSKILHGYPANYMELRSPCGAALGQMAYYANGDVFTCDEGRMLFEMGNNAFRLGNVFENCYTDLIKAPVCRTICLSSITESVPGCSDCVYQPFCGICPVVNIALYNDLLPKTPHNYRCGLSSGILDILFGLIQRIDRETMTILEGWSV